MKPKPFVLEGAAQVFVCGMLVMFAVPAPTTKKRKAKKR